MEIPVNLEARDRAAAVESTVVTWARHCAQTRGVTIAPAGRTHGPVCGIGLDCGHGSCDTIRRRIVDPALRRAALWLLSQVDWLRHRRESVEAFADLAGAARELRWLLDGPTPRWYAGPCNAIMVDGQDCGVDLYASPAAKTITCPACRASYDAAARRDWLLDAARDHLAHAELIGRALVALGYDCTPSVIRNLANRGRLVSHGHDQTGRPLYRIGDVLGVLQERERLDAERATRQAEVPRRAQVDTAGAGGR